MKKGVCTFAGLLLAASLGTGAASATTYTFNPPVNDIRDLEHQYADRWGINFTLADNEVITGASIFFDDIRNWTTEPNDLYVSLLDVAPLGLSRKQDNQTPGNYWESFYSPSGFLELEHYKDLPATAQDLTYTFDQAELTTLAAFLADGGFGLGFDADCHFYNNGISFTLETSPAPVPEPATMLLFGTGIAGLAGLRRRNKTK